MAAARTDPPRAAAGSGDDDGIEREDREGVFVIVDGEARFTPVRLGITGEEDFEILDGLAAGGTIVAGPFRVLRDLQHGDAVKPGKKQRRGRD